ncbi:hypothetical protein PSPO01_12772 [Paraphaeosphaeria sporulosa]
MATATPITSKAEFDAAIAEPTKFVTIYVHDGPIPEEVRQRFQATAPAFADKVENYKLDLQQNPEEAKEKMKLEKLPALLVFKGGKEVDRVYAPGEEEMKALVGKLFA